ncbi:MAG TPA: DUF4388 domain-containing protein, partial [Candidatus Polarisedimenticolia bacterium]|nr:DUF4388 domain-containing protein [Candidatus Polarisedimenticolia bacterium]
HRERFEGTLRLHGGGATRVLYFRRGEIASAASNADADRLPSILIREGRLTPPQVEMARARQRPGVSLGKTLIELGFLTPAELLAGARRQVRQILAAAFALREGTSQESPGPLPPEVTVLGLPARRLIFDALLEAGDRQAVVSEMGSMETIYRPAAELAQALAGMRLEPAHEEVARLVDGEATLREISGRVRLDDLTVSKIVLALEILGLVERASPLEEPLPQGRRIPVLVEDDEEEEIAPRIETVAATAPVASIAPAPPAFAGAPEAEEPVEEEEPAEDEPGATDEPPAFMAEPAPMAPPAAFTRPPAAMPPPPSSMARSREEEEEEDLPLIPPGELPAFAAPANVPTGWTVDPETGEKVHMGPVEMTFDGPVVPPHDRVGSRGRLALAVSGVAVVVVAVLAFFALRGEGGSGRNGEEIATHAASAAAAAAAAKGAEAGSGTTTSSPAAPAGDSSGTGDSPGTAPTEPDTPPSQAAAPAPAGATPPTEIDVPPPKEILPAPAETGSTPPKKTDAAPVVPAAPPETAPAPANAPAGGPGFGFGQRLLDAGTIDRAAETFGRALQPIPSGRYTLQMMIACEGETVRKARAGTRPDDGLFVLPVSVRGRGCYRVLWGVFDSHDAATKATVPGYFSASGITPAVVAIDRLRPAR